jgi:predicted AAA+ superfamily ATPase
MSSPLSRHLSGAVQRAARTAPVVVVTGPRQSGKTTLVRQLFADRPYFNLEDPELLERARASPKSLVAALGDGAVVDEAQRWPELFSYLQIEVDRDPRHGRFVLTGSENLALAERVSQSLAGRCRQLRLLPFSWAELQGREPTDPTTLDEVARSSAVTPALAPSLDEALFRGMFPRVHRPDADVVGWLDDYLATYVERDVRRVVNVGDLATFRRFLMLCAGRTASILNVSQLANDAGISAPTARAWLSVLEATFVVATLPAHHANFNKRLIKAPKLHFTDTGLACRLLGVRTPADLAAHPLRGALFETFVVGEVAKSFHHRGETPPLYYWRDRSGTELDLLVDLGVRLVPWEAKSAETARDHAFDAVRRWCGLAGVAPPRGGVVFGGAETYRRDDGLCVRSWTALS